MAAACGVELSNDVIFSREVTATPGTYASIAKITEFPQLTFTAETKECQDPEAEAAANGFVSHFKTGRKDAGEFSVTLSWKSEDASQAALYADYLDDGEFNYRILFADTAATKVDMTCLVVEWGQAIPYNDRITRTVKFRIQGEPVFS